LNFKIYLDDDVIKIYRISCQSERRQGDLDANVAVKTNVTATFMA